MWLVKVYSPFGKGAYTFAGGIRNIDTVKLHKGSNCRSGKKILNN